MSAPVEDFDRYRPPEPGRRRRKGRGRGRGSERGSATLAGQAAGPGAAGPGVGPSAGQPRRDSYYGRPIVKAPPWKHEIGTYLVLGGIAGGSALLAAGAQLTGLTKLRRNSRLAALAAAGAGSLALIADLGRPERFLNMFRTFKPTSPMSVGSWILGGFGSAAGVAASAEVVSIVRGMLPDGVPGMGALAKLDRVLDGASTPAGLVAGALGGPLAVYTAVLLSNTSVPTWNAARRGLPFVFASSASLAAGGVAMVTTPVSEAGPARVLAMLGVAGDVAAMEWTKRDMHPLEAQPLETGHAGTLMKVSEALVLAGGVGTLLVGRNRVGAVASGLCLVAGSALTRFGVMDAGLESTRDPKYVVEPQKARLAARRARGVTDDSIVTVD